MFDKEYYSAKIEKHYYTKNSVVRKPSFQVECLGTIIDNNISYTRTMRAMLKIFNLENTPVDLKLRSEIVRVMSHMNPDFRDQFLSNLKEYCRDS